jgi:hypothetical protein
MVSQLDASRGASRVNPVPLPGVRLRGCNLNRIRGSFRAASHQGVNKPSRLTSVQWRLQGLKHEDNLLLKPLALA